MAESTCSCSYRIWNPYTEARLLLVQGGSGGCWTCGDPNCGSQEKKLPSVSTVIPPTTTSTPAAVPETKARAASSSAPGKDKAKKPKEPKAPKEGKPKQGGEGPALAGKSYVQCRSMTVISDRRWEEEEGDWAGDSSEENRRLWEMVLRGTRNSLPHLPNLIVLFQIHLHA